MLVATACASPPEGRARWTLELLAGAMVKLTEHKSLPHETVRRRLAENDLKPWRKDMWCIPKVDGEYVARQEDVLDLYAEAPNAERPVVCFDESPVQLIGEARQPIPAKPGQLGRYDYEYRRNGRSISSFSSTCIVPGARSKSPSAERQKTTPNACAISSTSTIPMPRSSAGSRRLSCHHLIGQTNSNWHCGDGHCRIGTRRSASTCWPFCLHGLNWQYCQRRDSNFGAFETSELAAGAETEICIISPSLFA